MFGQRLREARNFNDYTLELLAEKYNKIYSGGLSKGTLSKYENGKQEPMISVVHNLAKLLNVSVDYLLSDCNENLGVFNSNEGQLILSHYYKMTPKDQEHIKELLGILFTMDGKKEIVSPYTNEENQLIYDLRNTTILKTLLANYNELNEEGKEKLFDYSEDLISAGKYKKHNVSKMANETTA